MNSRIRLTSAKVEVGVEVEAELGNIPASHYHDCAFRFRKGEGETYIQQDERGTSSEYSGHQVKQDRSQKGAWLLAPQETSV